jgi:hypothetical protein
MPEWIVRLVGAERDLRFLATTLREADCRVTKKDGEFHLRSSRFEALADAGEVKTAADEMIERANLAAVIRFERYGGVLPGEVVGLEPDGSRHVTVFLKAGALLMAAPATAFGSVTVVGSQTKPEPLDLTRDMSLLQRRPLLLKALKHVRDEPGWPGYWKAVEALGEQVGGLHRIPELGWASEDEVDRFRKTAHHHRHHRKPAPLNPMTETEGRSFVLRLLLRCLDWELSGRSGTR